MASIEFTDDVTLIPASWLNDINDAIFTPTLSARRASVYQYTAWDPSDVAGTLTNASATSAATSTAPDYVTAANSSGTVTFTCVKAGQYRVHIKQQNEQAAATTVSKQLAVIGGTATFLMGTPTTQYQSIRSGYTSNDGDISGESSFYVTMTAGQTVTILPKVAITSAGVTTNFTNQCTISCEYTGG